MVTAEQRAEGRGDEDEIGDSGYRIGTMDGWVDIRRSRAVW